MKSLCMAICTITLAASQLTAQRGGVRPGVGITRPGGGGLGRADFSDHRFLGGRRGGFGAGFGGGFGAGLGYGFPAFYGDYGSGDGFGFGGDYQSQPNIFVVMPAPQLPPEPPPPPPPPPALVVREYHWPASDSAPAPFSIVLNNGTVEYATMAWVEGDRIHFHSPEGGGRQVPLSSVSRSLTQAANARKGLTLPLP